MQNIYGYNSMIPLLSDTLNHITEKCVSGLCKHFTGSDATSCCNNQMKVCQNQKHGGICTENCTNPKKCDDIKGCFDGEVEGECSGSIQPSPSETGCFTENLGKISSKSCNNWYNNIIFKEDCFCNQHHCESKKTCLKRHQTNIKNECNIQGGCYNDSLLTDQWIPPSSPSPPPSPPYSQPITKHTPWNPDSIKYIKSQLAKNLNTIPKNKVLPYSNCLISKARQNNISPYDFLNSDDPILKDIATQCLKTLGGNSPSPPPPSPDDFLRTTTGKIIVIVFIILILLGLIGLTYFVTKTKKK